MEPLTWTGAVGAFLNPAFGVTVGVLIFAVILQIVMSFFAAEVKLQANPDGTLMARGGYLGGIEQIVRVAFSVLVLLALIYLVLGVVTPYGTVGIVGNIAKQFTPVWIALVLTFP